MTPRGLAVTSLLIVYSCASFARDENGMLGRLIAPNSGVPTLALAGGEFEVMCREQTALALVSGPTRVNLSHEWRTPAGGVQHGVCTVPQGTAPGMYALDAGDDINTRAVFVYESFPATYAVAHLTDPHVGSVAHARTAAAILADLVTHLNASDAAFAVVTGDLTEHGTAEEFAVFIGVMEGCRLPTFVTPGTHDRGLPVGRVYEQFFGPAEYAFRFGEDGYLAFDTSDAAPVDDLGPQAGVIERLRREIKAARWQVGLTYRYDPNMGMRTQLALFVDAPLDFLLFGHLHRENSVEEIVVPWGRTVALTGPAALDGGLRYIDVKPEQPFPRAAEIVAAVE